MKPEIFIGSSTEGKDIADAIQLGLYSDFRPVVWHQTFPLSANTIDSLLDRLSKSDFSVFIFSPDDVAEMRGHKFEIARDNVLFEAGISMGIVGKGRVFIVIPKGMPFFHVPTDLSGFTVATYDLEWTEKDVNAAIGPIVTQIKHSIRASSWTSHTVDIQTWPTFKDSATWPLKLYLKMTNNQPVPVAIESLEYKFDVAGQEAHNAERHGGVYRPMFEFGMKNGSDIYEAHCVIPPHKFATAWVPFEAHVGLTTLETLARSKQTGLWRFRCVWLDKSPTAREYTEKL